MATNSQFDEVVLSTYAGKARRHTRRARAHTPAPAYTRVACMSMRARETQLSRGHVAGATGARFLDGAVDERRSARGCPAGGAEEGAAAPRRRAPATSKNFLHAIPPPLSLPFQYKVVPLPFPSSETAPRFRLYVCVPQKTERKIRTLMSELEKLRTQVLKAIPATNARTLIAAMARKNRGRRGGQKIGRDSSVTAGEHASARLQVTRDERIQ
eukprot:6205622-Pleurochrysis_carterae.AAC.2